MAEDIAPALLSKVQKAFNKGLKSRGIESTKAVKELAAQRKVRIHDYASKVGDALSEAYGKVITVDALPDGTLYYNIAEKVVKPTIEEAYTMVSDVADACQIAQNKGIGLGLKPIRPPIEVERLDGLIDAMTSGWFEDVEVYLGEPVKNIVNHFADRHLEKNSEFLCNSGVTTLIIRTAEAGCCEWCSQRAGTYEDYAEAQYNEAFARHEGCRCSLEISSSRGRGKMRAAGHAFVRS